MSQLSVRLLPPFLGLALALPAAVAVLFAVAFDQGQLVQLVTAAADDPHLHEFFHDTRHMLGVPCH